MPGGAGFRWTAGKGGCDQIGGENRKGGTSTWKECEIDSPAHTDAAGAGLVSDLGRNDPHSPVQATQHVAARGICKCGRGGRRMVDVVGI